MPARVLLQFSLLVAGLGAAAPGRNADAAPALGVAQDRRADEVARHLADLDAPRVATRAAAERWLGAELASRDAPALAAAAAGGGPETRRRLAGLLSRDARLMPAAAALLGDESAEARALGEAAVRGLAGRYFPADGRVTTSADAVEEELARAAKLELPWIVAVAPTTPLEVLLERLQRVRALPAALVLEPGTRPAADRPPGGSPEPLVGSWEAVLLDLAAAREVALEAVGLPRERGDGRSSGAYLRFGSAGTDSGGRPEDAALGWVRAARSPDARLRREGYRALAASRWPAGLALVEERFLAGDAIALEAVLLAASDGRSVLSLYRPDVLRRALDATAEQLAGTGDPLVAIEGARRLLAAYRGVGCLDSSGGSLAQPLVALSDGRGSGVAAARRWLALGLLEALRCGGSEVDVALRAAVTDAERAPEERLQALRALVVAPAQRAPLGELAAPLELLRAVELERARGGPRLGLEGAAEEVAPVRGLVALLAPVRARPPGAWARADGVPDQPAARALALAWALASGDESGAAIHLVAGLAAAADAAGRRARGEALALLLADAVERGQADSVRAVLSRAREGAGAGAFGDDLARVALLADLLPDAERWELFDRAAAGDLALLGAVGGTPVIAPQPAAARARLLEALQAALDANRTVAEVQPLLRAHERVLADLLRAPEVGIAPGVLHAEALRRLLLQEFTAPLSDALRRRAWPWPPRVAPRGPAADEPRPPLEAWR